MDASPTFPEHLPGSRQWCSGCNMCSCPRRGSGHQKVPVVRPKIWAGVSFFPLSHSKTTASFILLSEFFQIEPALEPPPWHSTANSINSGWFPLRTAIMASLPGDGELRDEALTLFFHTTTASQCPTKKVSAVWETLEYVGRGGQIIEMAIKAVGARRRIWQTGRVYQHRWQSECQHLTEFVTPLFFLPHQSLPRNKNTTVSLPFWKQTVCFEEELNCVPVTYAFIRIQTAIKSTQPRKKKSSHQDADGRK